MLLQNDLSVMVLDGVTLFLHLKDVSNTCKRMQHSPTIGGISSVQWRKLEEAVFSSNFQRKVQRRCVFFGNCVLESK